MCEANAQICWKTLLKKNCSIETSETKYREQSHPKPAVNKVIEYFDKRRLEINNAYDEVDTICLGYAKTMKMFSSRRQAVV